MLQSVLKDYRQGTSAVWVQEEPENMGAWRFMRVHFGGELFGRFPFSGLSRPASASPATGSASAHKKEQAEIIEKAFED
jgi:2-oxoglutarate dehydrogenase E1 component